MDGNDTDSEDDDAQFQDFPPELSDDDLEGNNADGNGDADLPKEFAIGPEDWLTVDSSKKRKLVHDSEVFDYNREYNGHQYYTCHFYPKSRGGKLFLNRRSSLLSSRILAWIFRRFDNVFANRLPCANHCEQRRDCNSNAET